VLLDLQGRLGSGFFIVKKKNWKEQKSSVLAGAPKMTKRPADESVISAYVEGIELGVREVPFLPKKPARFICRNCGKDITLDTRMRCNTCPGSFMMCLTCFSVGAELAPHKAHHDYTIHRSTHFPLYTADWGGDEELLLLEGISLYGLGNWREVAQHVGTKTTDECSTHFFAVYVDSDSYPQPVDPLPEETIKAALPMPIAPRVQEKKVVFKPGLSLPMKPNMGSFMPMRAEFDSPFNEDAENLPADIVFNDDDTEEEKSLKVHVLQVYTAMLHERKRKTEFLLAYELLDWKSHQQFDRTLNKDDLQLIITMRPFLQFQSKSSWETFINGILAEQHLRREIMYYQGLRGAGLRNIADVAKYNSSLNSSASSGSLKKRMKHSSSSNLLDGRHNLRSSGAWAKHSPVVSEALSDPEVDFCDAFVISPQSYVMLKEACVRESTRAGVLTKKDARKLTGLPKFQVDQMYEFFVASGWVCDKGVRKVAAFDLPPHNPEKIRQYFSAPPN
jgi:transcriptional adapter 2-alpha